MTQDLFDNCLQGDWPRVEYQVPASQRDWNGLVLVGEAPGKDEVRLGRPFVGRSGQLLDKMLDEAGIDRARCLVANVFRAQPPKNKVDHFFSSRKAALAAGKTLDESFGRFGAAWLMSDYAFDILHLKETLIQWKPRQIVALGRTPFWALCGENQLLSVVGKKFSCRFDPSLSVIPTYHPSYIMRGNWGKQPEWLDHFKMAAAGVA